MGLYQGRALRAAEPRPRPTRGRKLRRVLEVLLAIAVLAGLSQLPWSAWREQWLAIDDVHVSGAEYLDGGTVARFAGVQKGADLLSLDLARARQRLLLHARIENAKVARRGLRGIGIAITERRPVLLVRHGTPWEMDSSGVLLAPFADGVVADVPLLTGPDFSRYREGALLHTRDVRRGLEWVRVLSERELQLGGRVSEIDVSDERSTALLLMNGTRVLTPAWPPGLNRLSALRVVLADLDKNRIAAREVDLRFDQQVIVRPAEPGPGVATPGTRTS